MTAANAERKKRSSTMIIYNPVVEEKEMKILNAILKNEETHGQWFKHGLCFFVLMSQVTVNVTRGSKSTASIFGSGFLKCTWYDFTICGAYILICLMATILAIRRVNYE